MRFLLLVILSNISLDETILTLLVLPDRTGKRYPEMHRIVTMAVVFAFGVFAQSAQVAVGESPTATKEQPSSAGPQRVSPEHMYARTMAIVPMTGTQGRRREIE